MSIVILPHLGISIPPYLADCVHQIRLWNKDTYIFVILDPIHEGVAFWNDLQSKYGVIYQYTDRLEPTIAHRMFVSAYKCDTAFRQGYWRYVVERFFYVEELMRLLNLEHCLVLEYDVLIYTDLTALTQKFVTSAQTCRLVCDNKTRCYPSFIYAPTADEMGKINTFIQNNVASGLTDMELLAKYGAETGELHYLPVITEARNRSVIPRTSLMGHSDANPYYLSEDSEHFGVLFDSLAVGQYVGGVDPRNMGGRKSGRYINETALYTLDEMPFQWVREGGLWKPIVDNRPLVMIHLHCKSLKSFLSDRVGMPTDDYTAEEIMSGLVRN